MLWIAVVVALAGCTGEPVTSTGALEEALARTRDQNERERLVNAIWSHVQDVGTPLFENDTTATFLYRGPAESVRLVGDMTTWREAIPFRRIGSSDLFALSMTFPTEARLDYKLIVDANTPILDPNCPYTILGGFGSNSEFAMPGYTYHPLLEAFRDGSRGDYSLVTRHVLPGGPLGYEKEIHVYLPPGYEGSDVAYPTVFFQDGFDYIEFAQTPAVLEGLMRMGAIRPLVGVFISPPNRGTDREPSRETEYHLNADYAAWMADELVSFMESKYRVSGRAGDRMVIGPSTGGLAALYIPYAQEQTFGIGYSQSGYVTFQSDSLMQLYVLSPVKDIRLYFDIGTFEAEVGKGFVPENEYDILAGNRRFRDVLDSKGYDYVYREYPEGHSYGNWRRHLIDALVYFFPASGDRSDDGSRLR